MSSILDERGESYGPVGPNMENMERIARLWTAYLHTPVTAHDVSWLMVLLKASRSKQDTSHQDNYVDAHGYVSIAEILRTPRMRESNADTR